MNCGRCGVEVSDSLSECTSCGTFAGFPNVRLAEKPEEVEALDARYFEALTDAESRGVLNKVEDFEAEIQAKSKAVVAMDIDTLKSLATRANELFSNYQLRVRAQARKPALISDDQRRTAVDGRLWGTFGDEIRYAALSTDCKGLPSYGSCFATLRNLHIEHRSSVLEMNSFKFVEDAPSKPLRVGFRSDWQNRHKVAVAKCAEKITDKTLSGEFHELVLEPGKSRDAAEYIEVHIFGPFDFRAFECISTTGKVTNKRDKLTLEIVKKMAVSEGKAWL